MKSLKTTHGIKLDRMNLELLKKIIRLIANENYNCKIT